MSIHNTLRADRDLLMDLLDHSQLLTELQGEPLAREELERLLDISNATCYRYTNRLSEMGMVAESGAEVALTPLGDTIAAEITTFEETVRQTLQAADEDRDLLVEITRLAPSLQALSRRPLDRRDLEERIDVSKSTSYRITRSLEERGLIEKSDRSYALTPDGMAILDAVSGFEANVRLAIRLGPVLAVLRDTDTTVDLDAFADATVTTIKGYVHSPQNRFLELLEETETLRGVAPNDVAPFYIDDIQQPLVDGLSLDAILRPEFVAQQLAEYPDRAIEVCNSDNVTIYIHDGLWYSLVLFDDRIGIGVRDSDTGTLRAFVDTDSPAARTWAEAVYTSYKTEAVRMQRFDPISLQQAMGDGSLTDTEISDN
jgi:predicted transcriptional regulator